MVPTSKLTTFSKRCIDTKKITVSYLAKITKLNILPKIAMPGKFTTITKYSSIKLLQNIKLTTIIKYAERSKYTRAFKSAMFSKLTAITKNTFAFKLTFITKFAAFAKYIVIAKNRPVCKYTIIIKVQWQTNIGEIIYSCIISTWTSYITASRLSKPRKILGKIYAKSLKNINNNTL